jgi:hypothetical protein
MWTSRTTEFVIFESILLRDLLVLVGDDEVVSPLPWKRKHATLLEQIQSRLRVRGRVADGLVVENLERDVVVGLSEGTCDSGYPALSNGIEPGFILVMHEVSDAVGVRDLFVLEHSLFFLNHVVVWAVAVLQIAIVIKAVVFLVFPLQAVVAYVEFH